MEMVFSILAGVAVGWLAGRAIGLDEYGQVVMICFSGAGAIAVGLLWTLLMRPTVGTSGSPEWIVAGVVGGIGGLIVYRLVSALLNLVQRRPH